MLSRVFANKLGTLSAQLQGASASASTTRALATSDQPFTERVKEAAANATNKVTEVVSGATERVKEGLQTAKDAVTGTAERVYDNRDEYAEKAKQTAGDVRDKAHDVSEKTKRQMEGMTDRIADKMAQGAETASNAAQRGADAVNSTAQRAAEEDMPAIDAATGRPRTEEHPHGAPAQGGFAGVPKTSGEDVGMMSAGVKPLDEKASEVERMARSTTGAPSDWGTQRAVGSTERETYRSPSVAERVGKNE